jgi:hypothetical protein
MEKSIGSNLKCVPPFARSPASRRLLWLWKVRRECLLQAQMGNRPSRILWPSESHTDLLSFPRSVGMLGARQSHFFTRDCSTWMFWNLKGAVNVSRGLLVATDSEVSQFESINWKNSHLSRVYPTLDIVSKLTKDLQYLVGCPFFFNQGIRTCIFCHIQLTFFRCIASCDLDIIASLLATSKVKNLLWKKWIMFIRTKISLPTPINRLYKTEYWEIFAFSLHPQTYFLSKSIYIKST